MGFDEPGKGSVMVKGFLAFAILQILTIQTAQSEVIKDYVIFDFRKTLPLNSSQPVLRDYYINMGSQQGVSVGSLVNVIRRTPVIDIYRNKTQGDLLIQIGRLRIIHVEKTMSVGRIEKEADTRQIPVVQFEKVMLGDRVELSGETVEEVAKAEVAPKTPEAPAPKRDVAEVKKVSKSLPKKAAQVKPVTQNEVTVEGRN